MMYDPAAVLQAFYTTRSVEHTAAILGVSIAVAHAWILTVTGNRPVDAATFTGVSR